ncbi:MAG: hypothetical protein ACK5DD_10350 [Cyclobacteriaceae bacterium]|jgi:hypothetical protein
MTYKITIPRATGCAYCLYEAGTLQYFINELAGNHVLMLLPAVPLTEAELKAKTGIVLTELKPRTANEKIAAFMMAYHRHKGVAYRPTKEERANIVHVTVNDQLLEVYFKATHYPLAGLKSIGDYIRHYNEVRDLAKNGTRLRNEFPDVYDREFEKRISEDPGKLQRYWQHLRNFGWKKTDGTWTNQPNTL